MSTTQTIGSSIEALKQADEFFILSGQIDASVRDEYRRLWGLAKKSQFEQREAMTDHTKTL
jgi:hypothetical protein